MEEPFPDEEDEEEEEEEDEEWTRGGRVIVHIDLDCFYAQVETLRNPELKGKALGIQQKSLVVTCNYEARKFGIHKLMSVKEALRKCPQLVLVNGEDLNPYREMSYKVTELLGEFCPLVERLGLDENSLDVTELVEKKFRELGQNSQISVCGHVYKEEALNFQDPSHLRLLLGAEIAEELRAQLRSRLGLSSCAGIAANKTLAQISSGTFKPEQQTLLLPQNHSQFLVSLEKIQKIPGIGSKTTEKLAKLGVKTIRELQEFPIFLLEKEFGISAARRIRDLSLGQENSQIIPWKPPQSLSEEDSFPPISREGEVRTKLLELLPKLLEREGEVRHKLLELLPKLLERLSRDGRTPRRLRLGIRKFPGKNSPREFRQCPIPGNLSPKFQKENEDLIPILVEISLKLFRKMRPGNFQVNLLSLGFSNLEKIQPKTIEKYLKKKLPEEENPDSKAPKMGKILEKNSKNSKISDFFGQKKEAKNSQEKFRGEKSQEKSLGKRKNLGFGKQKSLWECWEIPGKKLG